MSADTASATFVGVRVVGGLLPADLLAKLVAGQADGLSSKDFHLAAGETVRDAANRVWAYLRGAWTTYRAALDALPAYDAATGLTRERFALVLLDQLGYGRVHPTPKGGLQVGERSFPISHLWGSVPIHLLGRVAVDTRTKGVAGAAGASPQSMVQELLNRSEEYLWGILANATTLRLVRDSTSLVGSAYVEFDLEAIFDGDLFADFLLLYSLCHVSRLESRDPEVGPASCWLERWRQDAIESGSRALNLLRDGVIDALQALGSGFLTHPDNATLRQDLADGTITVEEINHALMRVTYRLLFTFVAEDRNALLDPHADPRVRRRYLDYFSTDRLRRTSRRRRGGRYGDRWEALKVVWRGLGSVDGLPELGLPGIGGLFDPGALDFLMDCSLSNQALQSAVHSLSLVREPRSQAMRIVDYRNLGAEELGSIYESLLELMPSWDAATKTYTLVVASGNQRKDTGSYYTPTSLVESLLDTALDPVLDDAEKSDDPEQALLGVTVCDPACGSGHFLVGAARRIAKRVAALRTGDPEPAPEAVRSAMRDVVGRSIYGVDLNPLAAELAKVSLWLEALEPGRPLTFLDAQIKVGNALVGATPRLLADGIPDEAFKPIEGDDKKITATLAKQNKAERSAQGSLFDVDMVAANTTLAAQVRQVVAAPALSLADVHVQEQRLRAYTESAAYRRQRLAANAWCAAFVWPKSHGAPPAITQRTITALIDGGDTLTDTQRAEIERLTAEYRFFHWHVEFPHIFPTESTAGDTVNDATGWYGGFSVVIGNPPWERVKLQEQEFFASRDPDIAKAPNAAARKRLIAALPATNPGLHDAFVAEKRGAEGVSHFMRNSGRYPLTGRGDINTYAVFAETDRELLGGTGRLGVILPTGIATDATTQYFFKDLVEHGAIASLYDFENAKPLFEGVHRSFKFCLLTLTGRDLREPAADFAFFAHDPTDLDRPGTRFTLSPDELMIFNPNTGTCPMLRSRRDAEIALKLYERFPVLVRENDSNGNPWNVRFMTMFHMTNDSKFFKTADQLCDSGWRLDGNVFQLGSERMLPLYEGRYFNQFNYRWATTEPDGAVRRLTDVEWHDPSFRVIPRYWVPEKAVREKLKPWPNSGWMLAWRIITNNGNERSMICSMLPANGASNMVGIAVLPEGEETLMAIWNSFVYDYLVRQKIGNPAALNFFFLKQIPVPPKRVVEGAHPFIAAGARMLVNEVRDLGTRTVLIAQINAALFDIFGLCRSDVEHVMDSFSLLGNHELASTGEYATKRLILEAFDKIKASRASGLVYRSIIDS